MVTLDYSQKYRKGRLITDDETLGHIRRHFSEKIEGIEYRKKALGNPYLPERAYAVQPTGMFEFGLYQDIESFLIEQQITDVERTAEFEARLNCGYDVTEVFDGLVYENRYYGLETVRNALAVGYGTITIGTGGGKSFIIASLLENIWRNRTKDFKCLIIVPGLSLVDQLLKNFEEYGVGFTRSGWSGKKPLQETEVVICNTENLCSQFDKYPWVRDVDVVITDEVHRSKSSTRLSGYISKIKTPHRFGFTGTLPPIKIDAWKVIGQFGPVIYEKNSKELRDENFLADVVVRTVRINHAGKLAYKYTRELEFIYNCVPRNDVIRGIVTKLNKNVLILVNHLEHGDVLSETLKLPGKDTFFVKGEMGVGDRIKIVDHMEGSDNVVCIAMSSIFSTGIDIKNLHYIMFVSGGKSFIRTVQSIGRGLRLHDTKRRLVILDIYDNLKFSTRHALRRKEFYDKEKIPWKETEINI